MYDSSVDLVHVLFNDFFQGLNDGNVKVLSPVVAQETRRAEFLDQQALLQDVEVSLALSDVAVLLFECEQILRHVEARVQCHADAAV